MTSIPARSTQTEALEQQLAALTGLPVGDGTKPPSGGWQGPEGSSTFAAYLVVHSIGGGTLDGPLCAPHDDSRWLWRIVAYSKTQIGAERALDQARAGLLGTHPASNLIVADRLVTRVTEDVDGGSARQDPDQPAIHRAWADFRLHTTPRSS